MLILSLGVGAIFFAIGLILAWSKSAKGSAVVTLLLGLIGGGGSSVVFSGGHLVPTGESGASPQLNASSLGWLLLAIGLGTTLGLVFGMLWKLRARKNNSDIVIGMAQPRVDPQNKIP